MSEAVETDVAIVGAGPTGLFAVFACGQLGMRTAVIDALPDPGGQLTALYPEKPIYDIPGRPQVRADQLVADLLAQGAPYQPIMRLGHPAASLEPVASGGYRITTAAGDAITARAVMLAAGPGAFGPNKPPLPGIEAYENSGVFYHVASRERFRGARVVIAGGGDSAVDWAVSLAEVAASVAVVHRRDKFRAVPAEVARMKDDPRIALHLGFQLTGLDGTAPKLEGVRIKALSGDERVLPADALIALFGLATDLSPLATWGVAVEGKSAPVDPATCETSLPDVYAIGDLAAYPGKRKLILTGFAEAAAAAQAAFSRVFPGEQMSHEHSTTRGAPTGLVSGPSASAAA